MKYIMLLTFVVLFGCQSNMYYWGAYQNDLYKMYVKPGDISPEDQITHIKESIEIARKKSKKVPPGVYIHLSSMYDQIGNINQALYYLNVEKKLFPESTVLVNGLIARGHKNK